MGNSKSNFGVPQPQNNSMFFDLPNTFKMPVDDAAFDHDGGLHEGAEFYAVEIPDDEKKGGLLGVSLGFNGFVCAPFSMDKIELFANLLNGYVARNKAARVGA